LKILPLSLSRILHPRERDRGFAFLFPQRVRSFL
jgi:hypothetical protein